MIYLQAYCKEQIFAWRHSIYNIFHLHLFTGLCLLMGVMRLPQRSDYWRVSKGMLKTSFGSVMSCDHFSLIWRYLHLHNRQDPPPQTPDRLLKVRWFIDFLNDKFAVHYTPFGDVTIDESMVRFKGRLAFRQYLPAKPIKWGFKIWTLAESFTGYMLKFQIYTGKEDNEGKGLVHRVVLDLMERFQDTNVRLYIDNFYTGSRSAEESIDAWDKCLWDCTDQT